MRKIITTLATVILALAVFPLAAAAQTLAITNARIVTVSGPVIPRGTIVVRDGKIAAVGAGVSVPGGARVIDARGGTVYPGLIEPLSTLGLVEVPTIAGSVDTAELGTYNPTIDAAVAVNPHSELIPTVRVNGITTVLAVSRNGFIAGQGAVVNLDGWTPQQMTLQAGAALYCNLPHWSRIGGGGGFGGGGGGGGGAGQLARQERERRAQQQLADLKDFIARARAYAEAKDRAAAAKAPFTVERHWEAMIPFVRGQRPWIIPADTADQIKDAIAFAKEQNLKVILAGAVEAWKAAKELAEAGVPVLINPQTPPRGQDDPYDTSYANAAELAKAGVKFAFTTNSASDARNLPFHASLAVAYGLPSEQAVRAMTLGAAEILGVADRVGSVEVGKVANLVVADGDILDVRTAVRQVIIAGQAVPMRSRHSDLYDKFRVR